jgi:GNAT superfamily N-acetyltransferase
VSDVRCRRAVGDDDHRDLARLLYRWRVEENGEQGLGAKEFETEVLEWMHQHRDTHLGYLARYENVVVGCAWLCVIDRIPSPASFIRRAGALQSVYVSSTHRDTGIGTELIALVVNEARAMGLSYLGVHPTERSFPFYRRLGFDTADRALELRF